MHKNISHGPTNVVDISYLFSQRPNRFVIFFFFFAPWQWKHSYNACIVINRFYSTIGMLYILWCVQVLDHYPMFMLYRIDNLNCVCVCLCIRVRKKVLFLVCWTGYPVCSFWLYTYIMYLSSASSDTRCSRTTELDAYNMINTLCYVLSGYTN